MHNLFSWLGAALMAVGGPSSTRETYVDVPYFGPEDLKALVERGLDVAGIDLERHTATVILKEAERGKLRGLRALSERPIESLDPDYKKPDDIERSLKETARLFPHLASVEVIGHTVENREIYAISLTAKMVQLSDNPKPTVMFDAMHHAREVMTSEVALDIVDYLTKNYATDAKVQKWLNNYVVWVVPMVNPDGNHKVWNSDSMWRKNNRGGFGVDINRNYPYAWNTCNGSSGSQSSETYRGPKPASEPETNALMDLAVRVHPVFDISYHSFSELVIYPYGCGPNKIPQPDNSIYVGVGKELAKKLVRDSGSGTYSPGTSYELLYNVDGGSVDWMYSADKIMSFVIEINGSNQGFQPSYKQWRDATVAKQRAGWTYILDRMEGPGIR